MAFKVVLVYPYFHPGNDNSIFRFPPLGLGYIAAALQQRGIEVDLLDCTFQKFSQAVDQIKQGNPQIVGFYSMFSTKKTTLELAQAVKTAAPDCLLVVGGPLPSWAPESFLEVFDVVAVGEGERTMVELAQCVQQGQKWANVAGLIYQDNGQIAKTSPREFIQDLDSLAFPTRNLFNNQAYKKYYQDHFGYTTTAMITSRGCPFSCDFCSRPIFGTDMRVRSVGNIVDEVQEIAELGYDRVWFADDCFTFNS